ncbi:hypothetical protein CCMSSC00406_0010184 [Pleurotus cornucopiae]|uniref:Uncharacterized protein n=1 Tax=Pleurotus cornucopiae TaxID=5321 RepID=A0ACB7IQ54_PLECO|nr:hypothetical protein CCMSSC00406_0010184 [Pleurotus cornucopiae]
MSATPENVQYDHPQTKSKETEAFELDPRSRVVRYDRYYDVIDSRGRFSGTSVEIKSPALCQLLIDINAGMENLELTITDPTCEPKLLFLSFRGLQKALEEEEEKKSKDEAFIADIKVAISYVEDKHKALFTELNNLLPRKTITFRILDDFSS